MMNKITGTASVQFEPKAITCKSGVRMVSFTGKIDTEKGTKLPSIRFIGFEAVANKDINKGDRFSFEGELQDGSYKNRDGQFVNLVSVKLNSYEQIAEPEMRGIEVETPAMVVDTGKRVELDFGEDDLPF